MVYRSGLIWRQLPGTVDSHYECYPTTVTIFTPSTVEQCFRNFLFSGDPAPKMPNESQLSVHRRFR